MVAACVEASHCQKGGVISPFLDTTSLVRILLETERKGGFQCDPKQRIGEVVIYSFDTV